MILPAHKEPHIPLFPSNSAKREDSASNVHAALARTHTREVSVPCLTEEKTDGDLGFVPLERWPQASYPTLDIPTQSPGPRTDQAKHFYEAAVPDFRGKALPGRAGTTGGAILCSWVTSGGCCCAEDRLSGAQRLSAEPRSRENCSRKTGVLKNYEPRHRGAAALRSSAANRRLRSCETAPKPDAGGRREAAAGHRDGGPGEKAKLRLDSLCGQRVREPGPPQRCLLKDIWTSPPLALQVQKRTGSRSTPVSGHPCLRGRAPQPQRHHKGPQASARPNFKLISSGVHHAGGRTQAFSRAPQYTPPRAHRESPASQRGLLGSTARPHCPGAEPPAGREQPQRGWFELRLPGQPGFEPTTKGYRTPSA